jgi:hypothetical protein
MSETNTTLSADCGFVKKTFLQATPRGLMGRKSRK